MKMFDFKLPINILKQGKSYVAFCPVLDLSTAGKSTKDARSKIVEAINIFLEEIVEAGTVNEVLPELGWKKVQHNWNPPKVVSNLNLGIRIPNLA